MCQRRGLNVYPYINKKLLKSCGLNPVVPAWPMPGWKKMLYQKKILSIRKGLVFYSVGLKNFWGKSSFSNPEDNQRYQLWYGLYLVPLDKVFELKNNRKKPFELFAYDKIKKNIDFSQILLLIQHDMYSYLFTLYDYLPQKLKSHHKILKEFQLHNLSINEINTGIPYSWRYKGNVRGKSLMYYKNSLGFKAFSTYLLFGWVVKNSQKNFADCLFKGDFVIRYIDSNGNIINPETPQAKFLYVGYQFGIHWESSEKKETSDEIMENLAQSLINQKFKIIKGTGQ